MEERNDMGIAFHIKDYDCKARWSYTGFNRFRIRIAESLGLKVESKGGLYGKLDKDWIIFLTHSDSSGHFTHSQCGKISKKLKKVLDMWQPKDIIHSYDLEHGLILIQAMEHCKENKKLMNIS
jgi:hypothetical protein